MRNEKLGMRNCGLVKLWLMSLLLLFVAGIALSTAPIITSASASQPPASRPSYEGNRIYFHGIRVDHLPYLEFYRLHLPLAQLSNRPYLTGNIMGGSGSALRALMGSSRSNHEVLVRVGFDSPAVRSRFSGRSIFFNVSTVVNLPSRPGPIHIGSHRVEFMENPVISLSNNYWQMLRHLTPQDFNNATIELIVGRIMYPLRSSQPVWNINLREDHYRFNIPNVRTGVVSRPPSVVDPNDPNFDVDEGNTGTNTNPNPPESGEYAERGNAFIRLLARLFGTTSEEMETILIWIGVIIAILIFAPLIIGAITSATKKE